ncbi:MAG: site-specific DNA-methyltransferase [Bacteroidales bacterium]|nr:site-specific DNA-methyltransferase [Bacteroidales bacterium]
MKQNRISAPVDAIRHDNETRAAIPTQELAGTEPQSQNEKADYDTFRHEFNRGCDPELFWLDKYRNDNEETQDARLRVDIRSLYVHEDIKPEMLIANLYRIEEKKRNDGQFTLFDESLDVHTTIEEDIQRVAEYYKHNDKWKNRLILGDSLLVMNSLLQRENMAGKVQCIYIDPPYGIKYGSNWQMKLNSRDVKDNDENLCGQPEMIKAFRDTWELGIHSYLSYLRDRLVLARELLTQSGSVFVQISDDNVHLVRTLLDEVFGSENFVSQIIYTKTSGFTANALGNVADFIIWYAKDVEKVKVRKLFTDKEFGNDNHYSLLELENGERLTISEWEKKNNKPFVYEKRPAGSKVFRIDTITSQGAAGVPQPFEYGGKIFYPPKGTHWKATNNGMKRLSELNRITPSDNRLQYIRYYDDFPCIEINNLWNDIYGIQSRKDEKLYVVQTSEKTIQRCILMTTDPGDLVLDPTCGSGTTAYVAEQWGRRWITIDTSRIALNIAKKRLTTAVYPYYELFDQQSGDIRQGFVYKIVPHITLKSLANNEPAAEEILYDQPLEDKKRMRVSGPFTVETLQNLNVLAPESLEQHNVEADENREFQERIFAHLQSSGIINGDKSQKAKFHSLEVVADPYLNARGWYTDNDGTERLAYFHIGPKFGTVSEQAVLRAKQTMMGKAAQGASWLVILGFSFEDGINSGEVDTQRFGSFAVSKVRMHDDLMQDGLLKKGNNNGTFVIIGEPDIALVKDAGGKTCHVEICGLDIYDPISDIVKPRSIADIAYWEMDDNYNGTHFVVSSLHFCGGDKKEFEQWRKGLNNVASSLVKRKAEQTLRLEFNDEIWDTLYGFQSEPILYEKGRKICVRVVSQFGEEASTVIEMQ